MDRRGEAERIYAHPEQFCAEELEHHTRVALRELAMEQIRREKYPQLPSRMNCLYVSKTMEEAEMWARLFVQWGRPTWHIVKVELKGGLFEGDANNCFDASTDRRQNLAWAERYWQNLPNLRGEPVIRELLADGEIEVLEIVRVICGNIRETGETGEKKK